MSLSHVLVCLADSAAMALRADAAAVFLLDESGTRLSVAAVHGLPAELLDRASQAIQPCALDREALTRRAAVVADAQHDPLELLGKDFRAGLCIPLVHEGHPVGTLHVYATVPERFCEDDVMVLRPLVDLGVTAIAATRAMAELEALEASQAQFIRMTTHELRSPVVVAQSLVRNVLAGYTGTLTDKQADVFTRISRRLDGLENLINDLLDLAAGKAPAQAEEGPVVLNASIGRVVLLLQPRAEDKSLKMTFQSCRDQLVVRGTEEGLDRIFVNVVGNAVKYTPPGGAVTISVQQVDGQAQVEVADTGIGIPEEALPHLFEEFYRAPNAKKAEVGTGLGLAIVKDLVERYGGRIQVKSTVGVGTTLLVTLPLLSTGAV
jgi:two-component system, OmpR family, phosphate regulon sensor histidine kinase PhoR